MFCALVELPIGGHSLTRFPHVAPPEGIGFKRPRETWCGGLSMREIDSAFTDYA
jgi:hypothetical protein